MKAIKSTPSKIHFLPVILISGILLTSVFLFFQNIQISKLEKYDIMEDRQSIPAPFFNVPEGIYDQPFELEISAPADYTVYYTTDGSIPTFRSNKYRKSITIHPQKNLNENILSIPTSLKWLPPFGKQNHCIVIRARCFKNGLGYGEIKNIIYCTSNIGQHKGFHVVQILMEADSLFSPKRGIYVLGEEYYSKKARIKNDSLFDIQKKVFYPANYHQRGKNWARPAEFILMDLTGKRVFEQSIRLCIHGMSTRSYPLKTLRIMPDTSRGDSLFCYRFFEQLQYDTFKSILLRSSGNDQQSTMFRDAMLQHLVKEINLDIQEYTPSVVYINGNYWGIHNIRERLDENYLAIKYGSDLDKIELHTFYDEIYSNPENIQLPPSLEKMINYIKNNSLANEIAYQHVCSQMDIDNFIKYMIVETFFANWDWPDNNVRIYKIEQQTEIMRLENIESGKWRWIPYDLDYSFDSPPSINTFNQLKIKHSDNIITTLFYGLLENSNFKEKFINQYELIIKDCLTTQNILLQIEKFEDSYQLEMERHIARWRRPHFIQTWRSEVGIMKKFAEERPSIVLEQLKAL